MVVLLYYILLFLIYRITTLVFDKTGTLTLGNLYVVNTVSTSALLTRLDPMTAIDNSNTAAEGGDGNSNDVAANTNSNDMEEYRDIPLLTHNDTATTSPDRDSCPDEKYRDNDNCSYHRGTC